jgi:hypothetical protein
MMSRALVTVAGVFLPGVAAFGASTQAPVTVPIEISDNLPVLRAFVGDRPISVLFDLGGSDEMVLTTDALSSIKAERLAETYAWLDFYGDRHESQKFRLSELRIGTMTFQGVKGHEDAESKKRQEATFGNAPTSGYVGPDLFKSFKLIIDYARKTMTFIPNNIKDLKAHNCFGTEIPFDPDMEGAPITKVRTDLGEHRYIWDTGAPMMLVRESLVSARGAKPAGDFFSTKIFEVGGKNFGPMQLRMYDFGEPVEVDGFIGHDFFAKNVVCIDMSGKRFLVHAK